MRNKDISTFKSGQKISWHQCDKSNWEIIRFFKMNKQIVNNFVEKIKEEGYC